MTRSDLLSYLQAQYDPLTLVAGGTSDDTRTGYQTALDQAFRLLGADPGTLVSASVDKAQDTALQTVADYYALLVLSRRVAALVTAAAGDVRENLSDLSRNVAALLAEARTAVALVGYGPAEIQLGRVQLDFLEPAQAGGVGSSAPWGW